MKPVIHYQTIFGTKKPTAVRAVVTEDCTFKDIIKCLKRQGCRNKIIVLNVAISLGSKALDK